jgi:hypothetical protein
MTQAHCSFHAYAALLYAELSTNFEKKVLGRHNLLLWSVTLYKVFYFSYLTHKRRPDALVSFYNTL